MWFTPSKIFVFNALLSNVIAHNHNQDHDHDHSKCATAEPNEVDLEKDIERMKKYTARRRSRSEIRSVCIGCETIDLIFHVLEDKARRSNAVEFLTDDNIAEQVAVLNEHFAETPFRFAHRETIRTTNDDWAYKQTFGRDLSATIASKLRKGGADVANLFFTDGTCIDTGGFASLPFENGMFPRGYYSKYDFIFLCPWTLSAGDNRDGATITHEVGHWLGLHHTFRGFSCSDSNHNDLVDDTPQQGSYTEGCPTKRDSCPDQPGLDPYQNFMDYTDPRCQSEFSPGQIERMYSQFNEYRRRIEPCGPDESDVHIEIQYDSQPDEIDVGYIVWSSKNGLRYSLKPDDEDHIDLVGKVVSRDLCIPKHVLHEIYIEDSAQNGLQSPGYYRIEMNGRVLATGNTFNVEKRSIFLSGDAVNCPVDYSRFSVDLAFDKSPSQLTWEVRDDKNKVVVDSSDSYMLGGDEYHTNYKKHFLSLEACLPEGDYTFEIHDDKGNGIMSPGFYAVSLDGKVFRSGGGDSGFKDSESTDFAIGGEGAFQSPPTFPVLCFPASSTVDIKGKGPMRMDELKIGDLVSVGAGNYEAVYSFGHYSKSALGNFLQLEFDKAALTVSADHLVFVQGQGPIPAALIVVGDVLLGDLDETVIVKSIKLVIAEGFFAPFTVSGIVAVNGVLASSFVALERSPTLNVLGTEFSYHWLSHSFEFPHRLMCRHLGTCPHEKYGEDGISEWVTTPFRLVNVLLGCSIVVKQLFLVPIVMVLGLFNFIEYCMSNPFVLLVVICQAGILFRRKTSGNKL